MHRHNVLQHKNKRGKELEHLKRMGKSEALFCLTSFDSNVLILIWMGFLGIRFALAGVVKLPPV